MIVDSQSAKAAHGGQSIGIDGFKKVKGRKRHILVDVLGLLWSGLLTAANEADGVILNQLVKPVSQLTRLETVLGDGAYGIADYPGRFKIDYPHLNLEISKRPPGPKEFIPMPKRWIVEKFFSWVSMNRRTAKDYEKRVDTSMAFLQLSGIKRALSIISAS